MNPRNFFAELKRRNVYKIAVAYAVVAWLVVQIATQVFPFFEIPTWAVRLVVLLAIIGFPIALVIAWAFEVTPQGIQRTEPAGGRPQHSRSRTWVYVVFIGAALSLALFFLGRYTAPSRPVPAVDSSGKSIAVLPFVDMSQAKDQEYFCDGISEEILDSLAKIEGLRVVARTSSFSFKGKTADVSEVATKLNVENVLEGSLRRAGNRIRITAQLINAHNGFHLWSETYERELQDVFVMQDEITRAIVDALKIKLAVAPTVPAAQNSEAHDLYLQGLFLSNKSDEASLRQALTFFQHAIEKDPTSARAWTGVAKVWDYLADAYVKPLDSYPLVKEAAAKAIALDERNAEAHCWFGDAIKVLDWNLAGQEREAKRALEIDPNSAFAHVFLGFAKSYKGDWAGTVTEAEAAMKLDPLSASVSGFAIIPYLRTGRVDEALATARRAVEIDPGFIYRDPPLGLVYLETERYAEAVAVYTKAQEVTHSPFARLAVAYAKLGRAEEARAVLSNLLQQARTQYVAAGPIAAIYVSLGENEEAFRWLDRAYAEHDVEIIGINYDPRFRPVQHDPRFVDLLRRVGMDPEKGVAPALNK